MPVQYEDGHTIAQLADGSNFFSDKEWIQMITDVKTNVEFQEVTDDGHPSFCVTTTSSDGDTQLPQLVEYHSSTGILSTICSKI